MKFRNVYKETNNRQHFTCRSVLNEAVSFRTRQCYLAKGSFLKINYYLHQLKIETILQKTEVSFLYKAVVENAFQLYQQLITILRASFSQSCNHVGKELKTQSTYEVVTFRKRHSFSQRSTYFLINYYNKSSLHSFRRGTNIIFTRGSRKKLSDFLNF